MVAEGGNGVDGLDDIAGEVARVAGHKTHPADARRLAHGGQQLREAPLPFRVAVAVHILAQELNLGIALLGNPPRLGQHRSRLAAAFFAPGVRHHAVGAELVAPSTMVM